MTKAKILYGGVILGTAVALGIYYVSNAPNFVFHGRVVDQHKNPVVGAKVFTNLTTGYLSEGSGMGFVTTDNDGYFRVSGKGDALVIGKVMHPELSAISYLNERSLKGSIRFVGYDYPGSLNRKKHERKANAYVINAWRMSDYEGAKTGVVIGSIQANKTFTIRLAKDKRNRVIEGAVTGDFHLTCTKDLPEQSGSSDAGWNITLLPIDGGIQETKDLYPYVAPKDGYKQLLSADLKRTRADDVSQIRNKKYYFKVHKGEMYGAIYVHSFDTQLRSRECHVHFRFIFNTKGSRNLQLRKEDLNDV